MIRVDPDNWVMIKMTYRDFVTYKLLADVAGSWQLLSHIRSAKNEGNRLKFIGFHDATFTVDPSEYGLNEAIEPIWNTMKTTHSDNVELLENRDWLTFEWK